MNLNCDHCGKKYYRKPSQVKGSHFCSIRCKNKSLIGKPSWNKGKHCSPKTEFKKGRVESQEQIKKRFKSFLKLPNKAERKLEYFLKTNFPHEWKFVGSGDFIIERKNPDFVNINGKKQIIELYGSYWHKESEIQPRIDLFAKYGYKTLILWDYELKNEDILMQKIESLSKERP